MRGEAHESGATQALHVGRLSLQRTLEKTQISSHLLKEDSPAGNRDNEERNTGTEREPGTEGSKQPSDKNFAHIHGRESYGTSHRDTDEYGVNDDWNLQGRS
jgi:hypothetical protein